MVEEPGRSGVVEGPCDECSGQTRIAAQGLNPLGSGAIGPVIDILPQLGSRSGGQAELYALPLWR